MLIIFKSTLKILSKKLAPCCHLDFQFLRMLRVEIPYYCLILVQNLFNCTSFVKVLLTSAFALQSARYDQLLKASHAFNILDSRGFIGVTERARYFGRMRRWGYIVVYFPKLRIMN